MTELNTVEEIDAAIETLQKERAKALKVQRDADFETVKKLCKTHGFTSTMLRGCLKTRKK